MLKTKLIVPLLLIVPTLFACNQIPNDGINANYVVQNASDIAHQFDIGTEEEYNSRTSKIIYPEISVIKATIFNKFTHYDGGDETENNTIRLTTETGTSGVTIGGEKLSLYSVNYRSKGGKPPAFFYAKAKDGYHFYQSQYDKTAKKNRAKSLEFYVNADGTIPEHVIYTDFIDNGFSINNNVLTSLIVGTIIDYGPEGAATIKYRINFTVTATLFKK